MNILYEKTNRNKPAIIKLKNSGIALLSAYSFMRRKGSHHVPHKTVDNIIAKFGFNFFSIELYCMIITILSKNNLCKKITIT
mgnify:CR=1 FL=1